jgi:hypothetical protein
MGLQSCWLATAGRGGRTVSQPGEAAQRGEPIVGAGQWRSIA